MQTVDARLGRIAVPIVLDAFLAARALTFHGRFRRRWYRIRWTEANKQTDKEGDRPARPVN